MGNEWDDLLDCDPENEDRDARYLRDIWEMASAQSQDPNTQVSSALVTWAGGIVLAAWNELPPALCGKGYPRTPETKNYCFEHAERRVLYKSVANKLSVGGLQMYGTWIACAECARAIIEFNISRVVTFRRLVERTPPKWQESVREGLAMMRDAGITVIGWEGNLNSSHTIRFNGEVLGSEALV